MLLTLLFALHQLIVSILPCFLSRDLKLKLLMSSLVINQICQFKDEVWTFNLSFLYFLQRQVVQQLLLDPRNNHAILCDNLKKVYPGKDGNPDKFAVRGLHLALPQGECFGMLGPNGAGKTSFINMVCC